MSLDHNILLESGTNEFEIVEFIVKGIKPYNFCINVAKVREVIVLPEVVHVPDAHPCIIGTANIRQSLVPIINLGQWLGIKGPGSEEELKSSKVIVTYFNGAANGFLVDEVVRIHRITWADIRDYSSMTDMQLVDTVLGVVNIGDQLVQLLDFERIVADINPTTMTSQEAAIDMSRVFAKMDIVSPEKFEAKKLKYASLSDFGRYPHEKLENIARLGVVIDELIEEYDLDAIAIRCWDELQKKYGIAPCLILGELNEKGVAAACELDVTNAVMMRAVGLAANHPVMLLDVNNNYEDNPDKVIFFHCGPAPASMMRGTGKIEEHLMFKKTYGEGSGVGINVGKYIVDDVTVGSFKTENGNLCAFVTEGKLTDDELPESFFGCGTVFEKKDANAMLQYMAANGYRHHVAITKGHFASAVKEAFEKYLDYHIDLI